MKDAPDNASGKEMRWAKEARDAFMLLDNANAKVTTEGSSKIFTTYNLTDHRDDQIVADYMYRRDNENFINVGCGCTIYCQISGITIS